MFQLGIRGVSSTARSGFEDAKKMGSTVLSVRTARREVGQGGSEDFERFSYGKSFKKNEILRRFDQEAAKRPDILQLI